MQFTNNILSFSKKNTKVYVTSNNVDLPLDAHTTLLLDDEKEKYVALKSEKRKKEFLMVRYLRNNFFPGKEIKYLPNGAPYFKDQSLSLSVSHTSEYVGIAVSSEKRVGLDIEKTQEKIVRIGPKFAHPDELIGSNDSVEAKYLTKIWCAKESLYKWGNIEGVSFKYELSTEVDACGEWYGKFTRISHNLIPLEMIEFDDHMLCFTY
jgi:phosphopantetheinyl transferase